MRTYTIIRTAPMQTTVITTVRMSYLGWGRNEERREYHRQHGLSSLMKTSTEKFEEGGGGEAPEKLVAQQ